MKYSIIFLFLFALSACQNSALDRLQTENEQLKVQIDSLEAKMSIVDDSFVIPYDSITQYMMPVTFGLPELNTGEKGEYTTMLAWPKFPIGITFNWEIIEGNGVPKRNDPDIAYKYVEFSYSETGEKEERGAYNLTLPNGTKRELMWLKPTVVK